jgi:glutamyl-tRNA synthetase
LEEYIQVFDIKDIQTTAPVFDPVKLEWMNGEYMRQLKVESLKLKIINYIGKEYDGGIVEKTVPLVRERLKKLSDYLPLCDFLFHAPKTYEVELEKYKESIVKIHGKIQAIDHFSAEQIGLSMADCAKELGMKNSEFFMILRVIMTGKKISPPLNESMEILGKEECLKRLAI